jgi:hypothetical protein
MITNRFILDHRERIDILSILPRPEFGDNTGIILTAQAGWFLWVFFVSFGRICCQRTQKTPIKTNLPEQLFIIYV